VSARDFGELSEVTSQNFAKACQQLLPILERIDIETQQALELFCDLRGPAR